MFKIKILHKFILRTFFPLFLGTYSVCIFILLMQFLWQYLNDMIGKGVSIAILIKLFFYAALLLTSMALPLSILLASLITFGNLGEQSELLAMKASGISLFRIMKPLITFSAIIAVLSFIFQNNIVPKAQSKMINIILSLKEKSPELDIPQKIFYKEIPGYNFYVKHKNKKNGVLYNIKIYDYSKGFENIIIIVADSGKINISKEKQHLVLTLYNGKLYQNMKIIQQKNINKKIPYRRETFGLRKILINFDTNFKMKDESIILKHDLSKNIKELLNQIKLEHKEQDNINLTTIKYFKQNICHIHSKKIKNKHTTNNNLLINKLLFKYNNMPNTKKISCLQQAIYKAKQMQSNSYISMIKQNDLQVKLCSHHIYIYKKISLSIACFLFFFIGAPLGSIIKKGGVGFPIVISVIIFLIYYIIDTLGNKLAKQGVLTAEVGVCLSPFILITMDILFTYQATNESILKNYKTWVNIFQKN